MRSPGMTLTLLFVLTLFALCAPAPVSADDPIDPVAESAEHVLLFPLIHGPTPARVLIAAAHIDSAVSYEPDEAILLWNVGGKPQPLAGWQIAANTRAASFPMTATLTLDPGASIWCAAEATAFRAAFGTEPACEWAAETDADVPNLDGRFTMPNRGGHLRLLNGDGVMVDALVYGDEDRPLTGWQGVAAQLYTRGAIGRSGQIWQRKLNPVTRQPVDSDQATDWASDLADLDWGRRVNMPGWRTPFAAAPAMAATQATVTLAVGPEGLYWPMAAHLNAATASIDLSLYTIEHPSLTQILAAAVQRGVRVRLLLEGGPAGGISDLQQWCVAQIVQAGGEVRYLAPAPNAPNGYRPRYSFLHAKYGILDGRVAFNGTENFTLDAMPITAGTPVGGRRGFYLFTDAPPHLSALQAIFDHDWSPDRFLDLHPFEADHRKYGGPPADFILPEPPIYAVAAAPYDAPVSTAGPMAVGSVSAPEHALDPDGGLLALIRRAGAGDAIVAWQLYEHRHWGDTVSNPTADPNPRVVALIDAARRGAHVRLLLDSFFDDAGTLRNNQATADYLNGLAQSEGLSMEVRLGNPTGGGIHAKAMALAIGDEHWTAIGSLNGGEVSHKLNREVVLFTDAQPIHARMLQVFEWDWTLSQ